MSKVFKTCLFKIHNPSQRRRAMMLDCMRRADRAFWKLMRHYEPQADALLKLDRSGRRQRLNEIKKECGKSLSQLPLSQSAIGGLPYDVAAQVSSFLELADSGQDASWPQQPKKEDPYKEGLAALVNATDLNEENAARDLMMSKPKSNNPRPLTINRNDHRGTILLQDPKGRLFAWINLHRATSRFSKKVIFKDMVNVRTGELIKLNSAGGSLMPLECSDWHMESFVRAGSMQSSRLIYRKGEFYLACTFLFELQDVEIETYLGIDRGIENVAAWKVINKQLQSLAEGVTEGRTLREYQRAKEKKAAQTQRRKGESNVSWRAYADQVVHTAANEIVTTALNYRSQVVLEDLSAIVQGPQHKRPKGRRRSNFARVLNRAQYQKLANVLEYKLPAVGLPPPKTVRAAGTSITCNSCGYYDKENRKDQASFLCLSCGHTENADANAAANIAAKYLYWREIGPKVKGKKMKDSQRYENWLKVQREA